MQHTTNLHVPSETLKALEWPKLVAAIQERCQTKSAKNLATMIEFSSDPNIVRAKLLLASEVRSLMEQRRMPSMQDLHDITELVLRTQKEGILQPDELLHIYNLARITDEFIKLTVELESEERNFEFIKFLSDLESLRSIETMIGKIIDEHGGIRDDASPALKEIRKRKRSIAAGIKKRIRDYLTKRELSSLLQDNYYTVREDRYVLPVESHHKREIPGIIHGTSNTGQTVYIEPEELVELNNNLKLIEAEEADEIRKILRSASRQVAVYSEELFRNFSLLVRIDLIRAFAKLAIDIGGEIPRIEAKGESSGFRYLKARHPLLVLRGIDVVPNDIYIGNFGASVLVISGPNTGGKTVSLKTAGLLTLMAQAGIPIPASADSELVPYAKVLCDIGDEQSIEEDLSTFSANIRNLNNMLEQSSPGTLLLLDEIIVGTEPLQGAALAIAFLEEFASKGANVLVTTHYEQVKLAALSTEGFENAAVGMDAETGRPNFVLTIGIPGTSSALLVARELGVPESIIRRASEFAGANSDGLENLINKLNEQADLLHKRQMELEAEIEKFKQREAKLKERLEKLQLEREELARERNEAARKAYLEAADEAKSILKRVQKHSPTLADAQQTVSAINEKLNSIPKGKPKEKSPKPPWDDAIPAPYVYPGLAVWVKGYGREGIVIERADRNKDVLVEIGIIKSRVSLGELYVSQQALERGETATEARDKKKSHGASNYRLHQAEDGDSSLVLDIRGLRMDDALFELERFLDRAYSRQLSEVEIIHGHGTGTLKRAVRTYLKKSSYVERFHPAPADKGGDGVTVVVLK